MSTPNSDLATSPFHCPDMDYIWTLSARTRHSASAEPGATDWLDNVHGGPWYFFSKPANFHV